MDMDIEASMRKSVEATQRTFNTIRTGRANPSLLDKLSVEYYGAETPFAFPGYTFDPRFPDHPDPAVR